MCVCLCVCLCVCVRACVRVCVGGRGGGRTGTAVRTLVVASGYPYPPSEPPGDWHAAARRAAAAGMAVAPMDVTLPAGVDAADVWPVLAVDPARPVVALFSSGSTGTSKGVVFQEATWRADVNSLNAFARPNVAASLFVPAWGADKLTCWRTLFAGEASVDCVRVCEVVCGCVGVWVCVGVCVGVWVCGCVLEGLVGWWRPRRSHTRTPAFIHQHPLSSLSHPHMRPPILVGVTAETPRTEPIPGPPRSDLPPPPPPCLGGVVSFVPPGLESVFGHISAGAPTELLLVPAMAAVLRSEYRRAYSSALRSAAAGGPSAAPSAGARRCVPGIIRTSPFPPPSCGAPARPRCALDVCPAMWSFKRCLLDPGSCR